MLNNVDETRYSKIQNWLELQRTIGFEKIRFYCFNVSQKYRDLLEKSSNSFVEIVNYNTSVEYVCEWPQMLLNSDPSSKLYQFLHINCLQAYQRHFFKITRSSVYNSHERLNTNDCLLKFKYEYEYVSNYDIDEIIFPRLFGTNYFNGPLKVNKGLMAVPRNHSIRLS